MPANGPIPKLRSFAVRANRFLATPRSFAEVKKATLIAYGTTLVISVVLLSLPLVQKPPRIAIGQIAETDIKAQMDLRITDSDESERLKRTAYERERPAFDRDLSVRDAVVKQLKTDFEWLTRTAKENVTRSPIEALALVTERLPFFEETIYRRADLKRLLGEKNIEHLSAKAAAIGEKAFQESGFLVEIPDAAVLSELAEKGAQIRSINGRDQLDLVWSIDQLQNAQATVRVLIREAQTKDADFSPETMRVLLTRVRELMRENPALRYNAQYTKLRRQQAADRVTPVIRNVVRGSTLIRAGDLIDKDRNQLLEQVRDNHRRRNGSQILGIFLIMGVLCVAIAYFTFRFAWQQMRDYASHFILHGLFLFMFLSAMLIRIVNPLKIYDINFILFVPFGFFGILAGQFFGARIALSAGVYLSIFSFILAGFDHQSLLLALTSAIAGLYTSTRMQKRTQMFKGGLIIAVTNFALVTGFELLAPAARNYDLKLAAAITNSILSILLTLGLLPLIEFIFNLPTPFRLMELNDLNHPLLTRMAAIAPSTHSHSIMLANLSEAAVRALGGDTLLTRVGCLFHDIGKMAHPDFYAENRHLYPTSVAFRKLGPLKSAQMIIRHVTDGIQMARESRLPEKIISFIPEHHGTTTIQFFYHKALEEHKQKTAQQTLARSHFQYPGPKPQSRETAVAMIADSVEAASRTVVSSSAAEFSDIIDRIIENKISEDQFHECPLTLGELDVVRKAFLDVLVITYHERPRYPTMQETHRLETRVQREVSVQGDAKKGSVVKKSTRKSGAPKPHLPELID